MRVRMTLQVPLTIPTRASIRLASSPRERASIIGIPPPTLASKAMHALCLCASANSSGPRSANRLLFAVTTGFPSFRARSISAPAVVVPPISSRTTCTLGSSTAPAASVVHGRLGSAAACFFTSRTTTWRTSKRRPVRRCSRSRWAARIFSTPPPTVPPPRRQIPMGADGVSIMPVNFNRVWAVPQASLRPTPHPRG